MKPISESKYVSQVLTGNYRRPRVSLAVIEEVFLNLLGLCFGRLWSNHFAVLDNHLHAFLGIEVVAFGVRIESRRESPSPLQRNSSGGTPSLSGGWSLQENWPSQRDRSSLRGSCEC